MQLSFDDDISPEDYDDGSVGIRQRPGNESAAHWFLKYLARDWLLHTRQQGWIAAVEVAMHLSRYDYERREDYTGQRTARIDCVGLQKYEKAFKRSERRERRREGFQSSDIVPDGSLLHRMVSVSLEVKVSRSDYLSGFYDDACQFNYAVTPPGILEKSDLPEHVGWLCYDPHCDLTLRMKKRAKLLDDPFMPPVVALEQIAWAQTREHKWIRNDIDDPFIEAFDACEECDGMGEVDVEDCRWCNGSGVRKDHRGDERECDRCGGTGNNPYSIECPECQGLGVDVDFAQWEAADD